MDTSEMHPNVPEYLDTLTYQNNSCSYQLKGPLWINPWLNDQFGLCRCPYEYFKCPRKQDYCAITLLTY